MCKTVVDFCNLNGGVYIHKLECMYCEIMVIQLGLSLTFLYFFKSKNNKITNKAHLSTNCTEKLQK